MIRLLIIFLILRVTTDTALGQVFSGQVYVMTEQFAADICTPQIECDCCSSDIFFLTDNEFIMVDRCIYNDSYYRGTYTMAKEYLTLKFDQFVVKETYDDTKEETNNKKQNLTIRPARFYVTTCQTNNQVLQRTDLKVLTKAFKESNEKADLKITQLKKSKTWDELP